MVNKAMENLAKKYMAKNENVSLANFFVYFENNQVHTAAMKASD